VEALASLPVLQVHERVPPRCGIRPNTKHNAPVLGSLLKVCRSVRNLIICGVSGDEGDLALGLNMAVDVSGDFRSSSPSVDRAQANSSRSTIFSSVSLGDGGSMIWKV